MHDLYSFVFKGLLTEEALDGAGRLMRVSNSPHLDHEVAKRLPFDSLDPEFVARSRRMATVYTAITAFEVSVRAFVTKRLLEDVGAEWWTTAVPEGIRKRAESRMEGEAKVRWHTPRGDDPLNYTELGDLPAIIGTNNNWPFFEIHVQSLDWAKQIFRTLELSRNVIMHSGELSNEDIERVGSALRDWIKQIGA